MKKIVIVTSAPLAGGRLEQSHCPSPIVNQLQALCTVDGIAFSIERVSNCQ